VLFTVQLAMSMTLNEGLFTPLLVTTAYRPSGEITTLSGSVPTLRWRPAGERRHPFGSNIVPSVSAPGTVFELSGEDCARVRIAVVVTASISAVNPMADRRIVAGETTT